MGLFTKSTATALRDADNAVEIAQRAEAKAAQEEEAARRAIDEARAALHAGQDDLVRAESPERAADLDPLLVRLKRAEDWAVSRGRRLETVRAELVAAREAQRAAQATHHHHQLKVKVEELRRLAPLFLKVNLEVLAMAAGYADLGFGEIDGARVERFMVATEAFLNPAAKTVPAGTVVLRFTRPYDRYSIDETAGFPQARAIEILAAGAAVCADEAVGAELASAVEAHKRGVTARREQARRDAAADVLSGGGSWGIGASARYGQ